MPLSPGRWAVNWLAAGLVVGIAFGQTPVPNDASPAAVTAAPPPVVVADAESAISWPEGFAAERVASRRDSAALPTLEPFDRLAARLIQEHHLPGLAIAVTDGGRLVHACGYGCGDLRADCIAHFYWNAADS